MIWGVVQRDLSEGRARYRNWGRTRVKRRMFDDVGIPLFDLAWLLSLGSSCPLLETLLRSQFLSS